MLKDEIWGCVRHVGLPYDTVMNLPIQDRRYFIMRHNAEQEKINAQINGTNSQTSFFGEETNNFTKNMQNLPRN